MPGGVGNAGEPIAHDAGMVFFSPSFWVIWSCSSSIQSHPVVRYCMRPIHWGPVATWPYDTAMWQQDLESRLQDVDQCEGFKYLPATVVKDLRLWELQCDAEIILICNKYRLTLNTLVRHQNTSGGIVVTGYPGIGTNLLQKDNLAHILITSR